MSGRYETAIEVPLRPGFTLWMQLAVLHLAAAVAASGLPGGLAVLALAMIVVSAARVWRCHRRARWDRLFWRGWGGVELIDRDGVARPVELAPQQFVTPWLVVLAIRFEERILRFPIYRTDHREVVRRLNQRLLAGRWRQHVTVERNG